MSTDAVYAWQGLVVRKGTAPERIQKLSESMQASLKDPGVISKLTELGMESVPSSPEEMRSYVQKVIDESLSQPGLSPIGLANRLNISVRHLYRLFEEQDDSVCRYIQRARLKRSADDLTNPFLRSESITSIAYKWGFTDSAHFSRSFKKQFEQSPKDFRAHVLSAAMAGTA